MSATTSRSCSSATTRRAKWRYRRRWRRPWRATPTRGRRSTRCRSRTGASTRSGWRRPSARRRGRAAWPRPSVDYAEPHDEHGLGVGQAPAGLAEQRGGLVADGVVDAALAGAPLVEALEARLGGIDDRRVDGAEGHDRRALDLHDAAVAALMVADRQAGAGPRRPAFEVPLAGDRDRHALLSREHLGDRPLALAAV